MVRVLDLFCGAGGAAMGYHQAGFEVVGVDINPQPRFPFEFHQADALTFPLDGFDLIHASPPCQAYSPLRALRPTKEYPDLVAVVQKRLYASGLPFVIENVPQAPLNKPITLCGTMFDMELYRHRDFETSFHCTTLQCGSHAAKCTAVGRPWKAGEFMTIAGHFSSMSKAREIMQIDWMNRYEMAQSIPPAYTRYIAEQFRALAISAARVVQSVAQPTA